MALRIFDIITIGIPFGIFKITTGIYYEFFPLIIWGVLDLVINFVNLLIYTVFKRKHMASCLLAILGKKIKNKPTYEDLGESLDVLFSFSIVALVIGSGAIKEYSPNMELFWNISVILNVLGAGSVRVFQAYKRVSKS